MGAFTDLFLNLIAATKRQDAGDVEKWFQRIGESLDRLQTGTDTQAANMTTTIQSVLGNSQGSNGNSSTSTTTDKANDTFLVSPTVSETILPYHLVSCKLNSSGSGLVAYLANASDPQRRANAVVIGMEYQGNTPFLRCSSSGIRNVRMSDTLAPTYDSILFVSTTAGKATADPTTGGKAFSQEVGLYLGPAYNALKNALDGVCSVDVSLPPPASMTVGSAV